MAPSSKITIVLLFAFSVVAATLLPSSAARAPGFNKAADESHEAPAEPLLHPSAASGSPGTPAFPGLGDLLPQLPDSNSDTPPPPTQCMTPLLDVMPCMDYLTNPADLMTPTSTCCDSFKGLISDAPVCICHVLNGDLNRYLADPVDPVRMVLLPLTCGALPPLQSILACATSQVPPLRPPRVHAEPASPPPSSSP